MVVLCRCGERVTALLDSLLDGFRPAQFAKVDVDALGYIKKDGVAQLLELLGLDWKVGPLWELMRTDILFRQKQRTADREAELTRHLEAGSDATKMTGTDPEDYFAPADGIDCTHMRQP